MCLQQIKESNITDELEMLLCVLLLFLIILLYPPRAFVSSIRCLSLHKLFNAFYIFLMFNIYYVVYTILNTHESAIGTRVPYLLNPPSISPPTASLQVVTEHWLWVPCVIRQTPTGYLFYVWLCICFNAIFSSHPTLSFPLCIQKSVLYVCVSFGALNIGSLALFLHSIHVY